MFSSFWQQKGIGIVSTKEALFGAVVSLEGKTPRVEKLFDERQGDVKPLDILRKEGQATVVSGIDTSETLVRALSLPLKKKKDVDAVLAFEAEPLLPFPIEDALLQGLVHHTQGNSSDVTLLATRKSGISSHLAPLHSRGVEPDRISCVPAALARFGSLVPGEHPYRFVVYLTQEGSTSVLLKDGLLIGAFSIPESTQNAARFRLSLVQTLYALGKGTAIDGEADLLFCGPDLPNETTLREWISEFRYPVIAMEKIEETFGSGAATYALPIGLAIQGTDDDETPNFRQNEFSHPQPWKKSLRPLLLTGALSIFLAFSIHFFGKAHLESRKREVQQEYLDLLSDLAYSHETYERAFFPHADERVIPLMDLSKDEIELRLMKLEKEINKNPQLFPLLPQVPRVTDVFAWFTHHPKVVKTDPETGETTPLLQLESFSYSMVKRPEISKPKEKYQVKVELEFSAETPKWAREFHDALIAPNEMVDPKSEVKWSSQRGKYRTSFYLKDKTTYYTRKEAQ